MKSHFILPVIFLGFVCPVFSMEESVTSNTLYTECDRFKLSDESWARFSNFVGYKNESDAYQKINGFVFGLICRCSGGMSSEIFVFVPSWFKNGQVWTDSFGSVSLFKGEHYDFAEVEKLWSEFINEDRKKYLDELVLKAVNHRGDMHCFALKWLEWLESAADTLKKTPEKNYTNVHKIILFCLKKGVDDVVEFFDKPV